MTTEPDLEHRLLDAGNGRKLESIAGVLVDRQAPSALWRPHLPDADWRAARGVHVRSERGGGHWTWKGGEPRAWRCRVAGIAFELKATPFGHVGLFAEQAESWTWLQEIVPALATELGRAPRVLNLFAYTGGSTLACALGGAEVTHVDAAAGVVDWARRNASANGLEAAKIRWIVDDARKFVAREERRGARYDVLILDPPSFGRGKTGEVWKIESDLDDLLRSCFATMNVGPSAVLLSCHSPGYTPIALENVLSDHVDLARFRRETGEMTIPCASGRPLPSGACCRLF